MVEFFSRDHIPNPNKTMGRAPPPTAWRPPDRIRGFGGGGIGRPSELHPTPPGSSSLLQVFISSEEVQDVRAASDDPKSAKTDVAERIT
jgi:hypothetical protein